MKNEWGKYRLGQWKIPVEERGKPYSEGFWMLKGKAVSLRTGLIITVYQGVFNRNLWKEGKKLEKELRKQKLILTSLNFTKL